MGHPPTRPAQRCRYGVRGVHRRPLRFAYLIRLFGAVVDGVLVELFAILCFGDALVGELLLIGAEGEAAGRDVAVGAVMTLTSVAALLL